jgi:hypothetical protein
MLDKDHALVPSLPVLELVVRMMSAPACVVVLETTMEWVHSQLLHHNHHCFVIRQTRVADVLLLLRQMMILPWWTRTLYPWTGNRRMIPWSKSLWMLHYGAEMATSNSSTTPS